jgi:4-amino-4-deoxy-L-arabinose transferase-like glycosyltransferase
MEARVLAGLTALGAAVFAIRVTGVPNLLDNEYRLGACALDVLQHGNWLCPHDVLGNTDKPPMLTWLVAIASWPLGRVSDVTLYLPTALATVVIAWLVEINGRRRFGWFAGALGALAYLCSHVGATQMAMARWDGLFALTVTIAALAAYRAWMLGDGWTAFWLAAAAATLTKGPLGVLLAGFGLVAVLWERWTGHARPLAGRQAAGIALFLGISLGWFALAYHRVGPHLIDNMIRAELVGNAVEHRIAYRFMKPIGDVAVDFAPWTLFALIGLYRIVVSPADDDETRCFERFLFCWFVGGLVLFSLSPHNQARLMDPMIPPLALIAGRELDRAARRLSPRTLGVAVTAVCLVALGAFAVQYHYVERRNPQVRETLAIRQLAASVRSTVGETFPLTYTADTPYAVQLSLQTMRPPATIADAAALLRGDAAAFVVVRNLQALRRALGPDAGRLHELMRAGGEGVPAVYVVGNRGTLAWDDPTATRVGPLVVRLARADLGPAWGTTLALRSRTRAGSAEIVNASSEPQPVLVWHGTQSDSRVLAPAETWRVEVP